MKQYSYVDWSQCSQLERQYLSKHYKDYTIDRLMKGLQVVVFEVLGPITYINTDSPNTIVTYREATRKIVGVKNKLFK